MSQLVGVSVLMNIPPSPNSKEVFDEFETIQSHLKSLGVHTEDIDEPKNPSVFPLIEYSSNVADAASTLRDFLLPILGTHHKSQSSDRPDVIVKKRTGFRGAIPDS